MQSRDKAILYQIHALRRMRRRGLRKEQIERAIRKGRKGKAKRPGCTKFTHKISAKTTIAVIAEECASEIWVVTAWKM